MKKLLIASAVVAAGALCLQDVSSGHGGTYRGPGDTVPPGGGGGGGAPGAPGVGGPGTPGPAGPTAPGPAAPGTPMGGPGAAATQGGSIAGQGPDLTIWQFWWGFNREPYLNLKAHIHTGAVQTGSSDFFTGNNATGDARDALKPNDQIIRGKVVPALIKALNSEQSNDIVTGCLIALAKIGDAKNEGGDGKSQMAEEIKKSLTSGNQEIQETAAVCLGILANEQNIPLLEALLFNDGAKLRGLEINYNSAVPERTRAFAAFALGLIGNKASEEGRQAIVNSLVKMLDGEAKTMGTRDIPVACLTSLGLTPLVIKDDAAAAVELGSTTAKPAQVTSRQEQILWLLNYFESDQAFLNRAHAPVAIARLLSQKDTPPDYWLRAQVGNRFVKHIAKVSTDQNEIKQSCILALGQIGDCDDDAADKGIRSALMAVTDELPDEQCKYFSMIALAQVAGRPGLGEGGPVKGLEGKGNARAFLMERLEKGKAGARSWAALALAVLERSLEDHNQLSSAESKALLRTALNDSKAPAEVGALSIAVGIAKITDAKDVLRTKFEQVSEPEAKGFAAIGLGLMDDRQAITLITDVVRKSKFQPDLLKSAATGLGLLGDKEIVPELITMLGSASGLSSQAAISSALGTIGDVRSIDPLIAMLEDKEKTEKARGFAAVALGIVSDKEELPWNAKISIDGNYRANTTTLTSPDAGTGILDIL
jgi:HEAT repeat protein